MSSATLQISVIPKRMLSEAEAAHHCGRPVKRFKMECPCLTIVFLTGIGGMTCRILTAGSTA